MNTRRNVFHSDNPAPFAFHESHFASPQKSNCRVRRLLYMMARFAGEITLLELTL